VWGKWIIEGPKASPLDRRSAHAEAI